MTSTTEVAILGGGLAGLHAAHLLHRARIGFHLFEARPRPGGRILTVDPAGQPAVGGHDLGPSWFWPAAQPAMARLVADLGLAALPQGIAGDLVFERSRGEAPLRADGAAFDQGSMRVAGGMGALVAALLHGLPADRLHWGAPVRALRLDGGGVWVTFTRPDGVEDRLLAAQVIAALPPRLLAAGIRLDPAPDRPLADRWRATPTWMAPHSKFVAIFDRPFWRAARLSGMAQSLVGPLGEIHDATTAAGEAALFGFVAVPAASRAALGRQALIAAAVDQLARLFGPAAAAPRATLLKDWAADDWTATPADAVPSGHPLPARQPWVTGPWADRLTLAGSESSPTDPGYLAGAVEASSRAVTGLRGRV
ncbi:MAG: FAD-dependent oxidoreductase [Rhodobacterales bacterium]|nr:FAD-dependent oxidoreductase [Rhodobacterales bacterium]